MFFMSAAYLMMREWSFLNVVDEDLEKHGPKRILGKHHGDRGGRENF